MEHLQDKALELVRTRFAEQLIGTGEHAGQKWVEVKRGEIVAMLRALRDELGFDFLTDVTAVDWLDKGMTERFSVVYVLYSLQAAEHFRVRAWVPEDDASIDSVGELWKSALWGEREVWDMYGITFPGNPDLRRLLMPEGYQGFPLRKDYPLRGQGERSAFPKIERGH